jgi:Flp pilus assembly secretin CpaC
MARQLKRKRIRRSAQYLTLHSPKPSMLSHRHHQDTAMNLHITAIGARLLAPAFASLALAVFFFAGPAGAAEDMLRVYMDHARVLKLDRAVSKVIIGNSDVADATVADAKTIVLTGRSFGTTNLVILDSAGNAIVDERILVSIDEGNTVRVYRQTARSVLSCTPNCEVHAVQKSAAAN